MSIIVMLEEVNIEIFAVASYGVKSHNLYGFAG